MGIGNSVRACRSALAAMAVSAIAALAVTGSSAAQDYPSRPVEIIVGFAPGGGTDLVARALAKGMSSDLGVPVQVVNRPGGSGVVGFELLAKAAPDGHTLGIMTAQVITANLRGTMQTKYTDFDHLGMISIDQSVIAVPTGSSFQTLEDLIAEARANPGQLAMANASEGGSYHMMARNLESSADIQFKHIPFDGGPAAILQLIGGHVQAAAIGATEILPHVQAGKARVLAVAGAEGEQRFSGYSDVPTTAELGYPVSISTWRALSLPKGADAAILERLDLAVKNAVESPEFIAEMETLNSAIRYFGPSDMNSFLDEQDRVYRELFATN